jgi:hypothetical protein
MPTSWLGTPAARRPDSSCSTNCASPADTPTSMRQQEPTMPVSKFLPGTSCSQSSCSQLGATLRRVNKGISPSEVCTGSPAAETGRSPLTKVDHPTPGCQGVICCGCWLYGICVKEGQRHRRVQRSSHPTWHLQQKQEMTTNAVGLPCSLPACGAPCAG